MTSIIGAVHDIRAVTFSPDGRWVATAGGDRTVRVWNVNTSDEYLVLKGHGRVLDIAFAPDSQSILTASADGNARICPIDLLPTAEVIKPRDLTPRERAQFEIGVEKGI